MSVLNYVVIVTVKGKAWNEMPGCLESPRKRQEGGKVKSHMSTVLVGFCSVVFCLTFNVENTDFDLKTQC